MKILHLAHGPMQGLPLKFVEMERRFGHESRLVYFQGPADTRDHPTIPWPLFDIYPLRRYRAWRYRGRVAESKRRLETPRPGDLAARAEPLRQPAPNLAERAWWAAKDAWLRARIPGIIDAFGLAGYDLVCYDGARDYTHRADLARELKRRGARIATVFYGTELRVEGVTPALDSLSDLDLTVEIDHMGLHPRLRYVPTPFEDPGPYPDPARRPGRPLRVVHAPSNRFNKGTDLILPVIERLRSRRDFEFVLVEGKPQDECRRIKAGCDLCIDQIGNRGGSGYGVSSLEMFARGIPCVSDFTPAIRQALERETGALPFHVAGPDTLESVLEGILDRPEGLAAKGAEARAWLEATHGYAAVYARLEGMWRAAGLPV